MEIMYECGGASKKDRVLEMTIEELNFSVRTFNCLKRVGLDTVEDLTQLTADELYRVRNLGKKSSEEVIQRLRSLGLSLRDPEKEELYARTIESLGLPFRITVNLKRAGIDTIGDLAGKTVDQIAGLYNLSYRQAAVVVKALDALGVQLINKKTDSTVYVVTTSQENTSNALIATTNKELASEVYAKLCEQHDNSPSIIEVNDRDALDFLYDKPQPTPENVLEEPCATFEYEIDQIGENTVDTLLTRIAHIDNCIVVIPSRDPWGGQITGIQRLNENNNSMESVVDVICKPDLMGIVVPEGVKWIGNNAFMSCQSLNCVSLPTSLTSIGSSSFTYCRNLTSIIIPPYVRTIGRDAFRQCTSLRSVKLPAGLQTIEKRAFAYCPNLSDITIPANCEVDPSAFRGSPKALKRDKDEEGFFDNYEDGEEYIDDCEDEVEYFNGFGDEDDYYDGEE